MLLVKTEIKASLIHGIGLFAAQPIAKGAPIWEYVDGFDRRLPRDYVDNLPELAKVHVKHFCALLESGEYLNTADNDRFINHNSKDPNMGTDGSALRSIALRDIAIGEEITEDYSKFCMDWVDPAKPGYFPEVSKVLDELIARATDANSFKYNLERLIKDYERELAGK